MICGNARNIMHRFAPNNAVRAPNIKVPHVEPKLLIEPSEPSCSIVIGPVVRGVEFDRSTGNTGDNLK